MKIHNPFHQGEIDIQNQLEERSTAILNGRLYEDSIIGPAYKFLSQIFFFVLSCELESGEVPITILIGEMGFISVEDSGKILRLSLKGHQKPELDPVLGSLKVGAKTGGLAIDLSTRRRLRINGHVKYLTTAEIFIEVDESYPNCPKYIQKRSLRLDNVSSIARNYELHKGKKLLDDHYDLIVRADTFFVGSSNPMGGLDASHRSGNPGFVKVLPNGNLRIPDYSGNSLYNTFGNFKVNKNAGLIFWDFENAYLLHLFGSVSFDFSGKDRFNETGGSGRWWIFSATGWLTQTVTTSFAFSPPEYSPFNPEEKESL